MLQKNKNSFVSLVSGVCEITKNKLDNKQISLILGYGEASGGESVSLYVAHIIICHAISCVPLALWHIPWVAIGMYTMHVLTQHQSVGPH